MTRGSEDSLPLPFLAVITRLDRVIHAVTAPYRSAASPARSPRPVPAAHPLAVITRLDRVIHAVTARQSLTREPSPIATAWMAGSSPAMTGSAEPV
jgi:hypothetical protein